MFDDQAEFAERFEWGEAGVERLAPISDVVVVVDVLRFTTTVDVAVGRGAVVYPYRWRDASAATFARERGALLAASRWSATATEPFSLSPVSVMTIPAGTRLVLPSPNGATLALAAAGHGAGVLAGCLRNAKAVAAACRALGGTIAVIGAGERWIDAGSATGSLRPAVEDLVGAGAILAALNSKRPSPEATAAMAAFQAARADLRRFLRACASGRELVERGLAADVTLAAELDVSRSAPRLAHDCFS